MKRAKKTKQNRKQVKVPYSHGVYSLVRETVLNQVISSNNNITEKLDVFTSTSDANNTSQVKLNFLTYDL